MNFYIEAAEAAYAKALAQQKVDERHRAMPAAILAADQARGILRGQVTKTPSWISEQLND